MSRRQLGQYGGVLQRTKVVISVAGRKASPAAGAASVAMPKAAVVNAATALNSWRGSCPNRVDGNSRPASHGFMGFSVIRRHVIAAKRPDDVGVTRAPDSLADTERPTGQL